MQTVECREFFFSSKYVKLEDSVNSISQIEVSTTFGASCFKSVIINKKLLKKKYYVTTWSFEGTPVAIIFVVKPICFADACPFSLLACPFSLLARALSAKKGKETQDH